MGARAMSFMLRLPIRCLANPTLVSQRLSRPETSHLSRQRLEARFVI